MSRAMVMAGALFLSMFLSVRCASNQTTSQPKDPAPQKPFDLVIRNGRIMDPDSKFDAVGHLGIRDGKIRAISEHPISGGENDRCARHGGGTWLY